MIPDPHGDARRLVLHARVVTGAGGGPDKTILNSPRFLEGTRYRALCAYLRDPHDPGFAELELRAQRWKAPLVGIDDHGPLDWKVLDRCRNLCREQRPAIWHGHDYKSNLLGLLVRRQQPMALVTTVHGWVKRTWKTPLYYAIDRWCLRRYDAVLCVSTDLLDACLEIGVEPERCSLVPNAIDLDEYRPAEARKAATAGPGADSASLLIGAVGRLSREKGFDRLIRATGLLLAGGLDVQLWIAGEGDARRELEALVAELGLKDRVRMPGQTSEVLDLYRRVDLLAISSSREGLPNVLLEAMAMELPVVCTRVGGIESVISDGVNGLLVDSGSEDTLAAALQQLALDPELRSRLGRAARATVERSFSFAERMQRVCDTYDKILEREAP